MNKNHRLTSLTVEGYRCFRSKQSVRLAPLTFLVGANSTGKTSFLAILRAIWNVVVNGAVPDFREDPYDLGTFHDIIYTSRNGQQNSSFAAELDFVTDWNSNEEYNATVEFDERGGSPFPFKRRLTESDVWLEVQHMQDGLSLISLGVHGNTWKYKVRTASDTENMFELWHLYFCLHLLQNEDLCVPIGDSEASRSKNDLKMIQELVRNVYPFPLGTDSVFASAPVRSRPKRTYDPTRPSRDSEGQYVPTYLATVNYRNERDWRRMKKRLERFGRAMGLFQEIRIRKLSDDLGGAVPAAGDPRREFN